jgi:hypothetical protein
MATSALAVFLLWFGVSAAPQTPGASPEPVGKISVTAKGRVSLDGTPITLDALKVRLVDLKKRKGVVWYYRESGASDPPAQAMQVIKLIADLELPISMSTKPDFSDVLLPDGSTRPRVQRLGP